MGVDLHRMGVRLRRHLEVTLLLRRRRNAIRDLLLLGRGLGLNAALASVKAGPVCTGPIHALVCIDIVDAPTRDVVGRRIVGKMSVVPATAAVAVAPVAVPVIHAAIKPNRRAPVARIEGISAVVPSPISRSPIQANFRRLHPCARHPIIFASIVIVGPVTRSPNVTVIRAGWLRLGRDRPL